MWEGPSRPDKTFSYVGEYVTASGRSCCARDSHTSLPANHLFTTVFCSGTVCFPCARLAAATVKCMLNALLKEAQCRHNASAFPSVSKELHHTSIRFTHMQVHAALQETHHTRLHCLLTTTTNHKAEEFVKWTWDMSDRRRSNAKRCHLDASIWACLTR